MLVNGFSLVGKKNGISDKEILEILKEQINTEGIYEFSNNEDEDRLKPPEKNTESFQKLGEIIGVDDYLVQIDAEYKTYNYNLEKEMEGF